MWSNVTNILPSIEMRCDNNVYLEALIVKVKKTDKLFGNIQAVYRYIETMHHNTEVKQF